jgi:hypothetical protein
METAKGRKAARKTGAKGRQGQKPNIRVAEKASGFPNPLPTCGRAFHGVVAEGKERRGPSRCPPAGETAATFEKSRGESLLRRSSLRLRRPDAPPTLFRVARPSRPRLLGLLREYPRSFEQSQDAAGLDRGWRRMGQWYGSKLGLG